MDLDMMEMDVDVDDAQYNAAPIPEAYTHDIITGEEQEPGEVDEDIEDAGANDNKDATIVPYKIHLRGLDTFTPDDVRAYVAQHFDGHFERIEWIDDSSANLLFKAESSAQEALVSLSALTIADPSSLPPLESVPAKQYAAKPDSILQVRFAVEGDKKVVGAAQRSRFYLMNPEYDPEERRRHEHTGRSKYRDRDDGYRGNRRGGRDERRGGRRGDEAGGLTFDASLYDDDSSALAQRSSGRRDQQRRKSPSIDSDHSDRHADRYRPHPHQNREKELFPGRLNSSSHRDRARSASPVRDRDGDAHMGEDEGARATAAMRSREKGRSIKERLTKETSNRDIAPRELFPGKAHGAKELFPSKVSAGLGGKAQMDQVDDGTILASAKLADRITTRPTSTSAPSPSGGGLNIRGLASKHGASGGEGGDRQGIAIKGTGTSVKELFPEKFGNNAAKELFAEKLEGRGRRRQRAEDLFY